MRRQNDVISLSYRTDDIEVVPPLSPEERQKRERDLHLRIEAVENGLDPKELPPSGPPLDSEGDD